MSVPVSALEVGKCYLTNTGRIWRIIQRMPDGRVLYEHRSRSLDSDRWTPGMLMKSALPAEVLVERKVPCDLRPEADGKQP
jgi:hypothetical protein